MRPFLLAALIMIASLTQVSAQTIPAFPTLTYPQPGTFCGLLTLCIPTDTRSDEKT